MRSAALPLVVLSGCLGGTETGGDPATDAPPPAAELAHPLSFQAISLPEKGPSETLLATPAATSGEAAVSEPFTALLPQETLVRGMHYGRLSDEGGVDIEPELPCPRPAGAAVIPAEDGGLFHVAGTDCQPSAAWWTRVSVDGEGGLAARAARPVDLSALGGAGGLRGAASTPWGTALLVEGMEGDARRIRPDGQRMDGYRADGYDPFLFRRYFRVPARRPWVYDHGWALEISAAGDRAVRRPALGRLAHADLVALPDGRTVYLADGAVNGGLFLFVADRPGDLSSGALYAARWTQQRARDGGAGQLDWVPLGRADEAALEPELAAGALHFDEIFEVADPVEAPPADDVEAVADTDREPSCPEGFSPVNTRWGAECLRLRAGVDPVLASRLETRRVAALGGATTELRGIRGLTWDPDHGVLYAALESVQKGMIPHNPEWDVLGPDHIRVDENRCGGVYSLTVAEQAVDTAGEAIDSPYVATAMAGFLLGRPEGFGCAAGAPAGLRALTYLPGTGTLLLGEGAGPHPNPLVWAADVGALHAGRLAGLTPILAAPPGASIAGLDVGRDAAGRGWVSVSIAHPWEGVSGGEARPAAERLGLVGLLGPFSVTEEGPVSPAGDVFGPAPAPDTDAPDPADEPGPGEGSPAEPAGSDTDVAPERVATPALIPE
jgi:uncharacterized protein